MKKVRYSIFPHLEYYSSERNQYWDIKLCYEQLGTTSYSIKRIILLRTTKSYQTKDNFPSDRIDEVRDGVSSDTKLHWFHDLCWGRLCGWWCFWRALDSAKRVRRKLLICCFRNIIFFDGFMNDWLFCRYYGLLIVLEYVKSRMYFCDR